MPSLRDKTASILSVMLLLAGGGLTATALVRWSKGKTNLDYISPTGFKPVSYGQPGSRVSYTMLDVIPEENDYVRWINRQDIPANSEHERLVNYRHARSNCSSMMMQTIGEGDTIPKMVVNRPTGYYNLVEGSSAHEGTRVACREKSLLPRG